MAIIKVGNRAIDLDAAEIPNIPADKISTFSHYTSKVLKVIKF